MAAFFGRIQLDLHLLNIQQLLLKLGPALGNLLHKSLQLLAVAAGGVVQLNQLFAFGQGKTDALAAQISFGETLSRAV